MILTAGPISLLQLNSIISRLSHGVYQLLCLLLIIFTFNLPCHMLGRLAHCSDFFLSLAWIYRSSLFWAMCRTEVGAENGTHHTKTPNTRLSLMLTPGPESYFLFPSASFPTLPTSVNWSNSSRKWNHLCYFYIWDNVETVEDCAYL